MKLKQTLLQFFYPLIVLFTRKDKKMGFMEKNENGKAPVLPIHRLFATKINGEKVALNQFAGKKMMIVNTASDCGFTNQYKSLQKLYENNEDLVILGFPSNDFKDQEKESNEKIAEFCEVNFGVTFPLFQKTGVVQPPTESVFDWLSDKKKNGWNDIKPTWNFCKYLIDEKGVLLSVAGPAVEPDKVLQAK